MWKRLLQFGFCAALALVPLATVGCSREKKEAKAPGEVAQQERTKVEEKAPAPETRGTRAVVAEAPGTGTITGVVKFAGTPPKLEKIQIEKDRAKCGTEKLSEKLVVGQDKGIKWSVVSLVGAHMGKPLMNPVLNQKGCQFIPHVVVVPAGGTLDILNSDGILHNIHTYSTKNPSFNRAQPGFKKKLEEKFNQPEIVKVTCDVHPWMAGWIVVADSPTTVTDEKGSFMLANIPAGTYQLRVWHEVLGEKTQEVTVKAGEMVKVAFELAKK